MSRLIDLTGLSRFLNNCKEIFVSKDDTSYEKKADNPFEKGLGTDSAVQKGSNNTALGQNSFAEGTASTMATDRGINESSTDSEIIDEWSSSDPESEKFSLAKGRGSHVEGNNCLALGDFSHAEGDGTIAESKDSHSEGVGSRASGKYSHAEGLETTASGERSHAEGKGSVSSAKSSHAEGAGTTASGERSHAEGFESIASGKQAHAEGWGTSATKSQAHAEGSNTKAEGNASHSEGTRVVASGDSSHAEGVREPWTYTEVRTFLDNIKSGATESKLYQTLNYSSAAERYAVGIKIISIDGEDVSDQDITVTAVYGNGSKWFSLSEKLGIGDKSTVSVEFVYEETVITEYPNIGAKGEASHIEGVGTSAHNKGEHAEGRYNLSNAKTIHSVGIGTAHDHRVNAFEILDDGNAYLLFVGGYDGTNPNVARTLQDLLILADTAYQKPQTGIPESDLSEGVREKLNNTPLIVSGTISPGRNGLGQEFTPAEGECTFEEAFDAYKSGRTVILEAQDTQKYTTIIGYYDDGGGDGICLYGADWYIQIPVRWYEP